MEHRERPRLRLVPASDAPAAAPRPLGAVELLPGRVRAAALDMSGAVLCRAESHYPAASAVAADVDAALARVADVCFAARPPMGIGVAAAGLLDPTTGVVIEVNDAPALHGYQISAVLSRLTGVPVHIEHRARLQVLGDRWFGAGRGHSSFASVATGEVLGVGILHEGQVLAPRGGRSGAHMTVAAQGRLCVCGARGCWKTVASAQWLRDRTAELGFEPEVGIGDLAERATRDTAAAGLLDEYAANLALGLVNVQQLFAPGLFVLHGGARDGGEWLRSRIEARLRADSSWSDAAPPRVVFSDQPGDDIALLGGAGLVLSQR